MSIAGIGKILNTVLYMDYKPKPNFELIILMFSFVEFDPHPTRNPPPPTPEDFDFDKLKSTLSELTKVKTFLGFSRQIVF